METISQSDPNPIASDDVIFNDSLNQKESSFQSILSSPFSEIDTEDVSELLKGNTTDLSEPVHQESREESRSMTNNPYESLLYLIDGKFEYLQREINALKEKYMRELSRQKDEISSFAEHNHISDFMIDSWNLLKQIKETAPHIDNLCKRDKTKLLNKSERFYYNINFMKDYLDEFRKNVINSKQNSNLTRSPIFDNILFTSNNLFKIKYYDINSNYDSNLKKIIKITKKDKKQLLWTRLLSNEVILSFYELDNNAYELELSDIYSNVIKQIYMSYRVDICECFNGKIVISRRIIDRNIISSEISIYDYRLRLMNSRKFQNDLKIHYVNESEIICWSNRQPYIRVLNLNLEVIDAFGQRIKYMSDFYLPGSVYWVFGSTKERLYIGNMDDRIDIYCRYSGRLIKSEFIEGLTCWSAILDLNERIILIIKSRNLTRVYDRDLGFLAEKCLDFVGTTCCFQLTSQNDIVFIDYFNNIIRII